MCIYLPSYSPKMIEALLLFELNLFDMKNVQKSLLNIFRKSAKAVTSTKFHRTTKQNKQMPQMSKKITEQLSTPHVVCWLAAGNGHLLEKERAHYKNSMSCDFRSCNLFK